MKRAPYASKNELLDMMALAALGGAAEDMAKRCPEKDWSKKLKTMSTYCDNILLQRVLECDPKQQESIKRRAEHTILRVITSDQYRFEDVGPKPEITDETVVLKIDDFFDLCDCACMGNCWSCAQTEDAKEVCNLRKLYHKFGVPVTREKPGKDECEFCPKGNTGLDRL